MYARVFDLSVSSKGKMPEITEEGHALLARAKINPSEILPKSYEEFLHQEQRGGKSPASPRGKRVSMPEPSISMGTNIGGRDK